jgi:hypothetical protein
LKICKRFFAKKTRPLHDAKETFYKITGWLHNFIKYNKIFRYLNTPGIFFVADPQHEKMPKNAEKKTVASVMHYRVYFVKSKMVLTA